MKVHEGKIPKTTPKIFDSPNLSVTLIKKKINTTQIIKIKNKLNWRLYFQITPKITYYTIQNLFLNQQIQKDKIKYFLFFYFFKYYLK